MNVTEPVDSITTVGNNSSGTPIMTFNINFTASVLSAQNPIKVSIIAVPTPEFQAMNPTVNDFYFYLQGAVPSQPTYNKYGGENISQIDLHKEADGTYRGGDTIIFDYEGDKCFTAAPQPPPTVKGLCHEGQEPIIHISSADSLFQLQTQHVTIALTWAFGAFTVILIREFVMGFGSNTMALLHRRQKEHMDADNALTLAFGTLTAILIQECVMTLWRRRHKERMDADNNPNAQKDNSKNGKNHRN